MKDKIKAFWADEAGASAVEYGLLIAGIAAAVMAVIYGIGSAMRTKFSQVQTQLSQ